MKKKFFIKTFGCQMNKSDSLLIQQLLADAGFESTLDPDGADIHIVNTCTVRQHAANRALAYVSGLQRWHRQGGRVLCVAGCLAQAEADEISKRLQFVDLILGPDAYHGIGAHVKEIMARRSRIIDTRLTAQTYCGIFHPAAGVADFIAIMRGCSNYCSYCIVPHVRGAARSRPYDDIRAEIAHLIERGVKDITLLGQNVNEYRHADLDFAGLLARVARIPGICRIRFLTSHPRDFSAPVVDAVRENPALCEWFHLPAQSGSDRILELMNRRYTRQEYTALIRMIRDRIPDAAVTTDIMVGFPGETEAEFGQTLALLEELRFDDAYMYRYSPRPGTRASQMAALDEPTVRQRLATLIALQRRIVREKTQAMVGRAYEVLIEGAAKHNGARGKTRGNKDVVVRRRLAPGTLLEVVIKEIQGHTPIGEPVA